MRALVAGPDASTACLAATLHSGSMQIDHCATPEETRRRLADTSLDYALILLCRSWDVPPLKDLIELAQQHQSACVMYTKAVRSKPLAQTPSGYEALDAGTAPELTEAEIEQWRNVLTFAKRSPDAYPAFRDALGTQTNLFQYHAPVKRSA